MKIMPPMLNYQQLREIILLTSWSARPQICSKLLLCTQVETFFSLSLFIPVHSSRLSFYFVRFEKSFLSPDQPHYQHQLWSRSSFEGIYSFHLFSLYSICVSNVNLLSKILQCTCVRCMRAHTQRL